MGQGFQYDIFNSTTRALSVGSSTSNMMWGNLVPSPITLNPGEWISKYNQNGKVQPWYAEIDSGGIGTMSFSVALTGSTTPPQGFFIVTFDRGSITGYSGVTYLNNSGSISPVMTGANTYIYPLVYLRNYGEWTQACIVLSESTVFSVPGKAFSLSVPTYDS